MGIAALVEVPGRRLSPGMQLLDTDGAIVEVVRAKLRRRWGVGGEIVRVWLRDRDGEREAGWVPPDQLVPIFTR